MIPTDTPAIVTDDFGHRWQTRTRSDPWTLGDGTLVQSIDGIAGGYLAERLTPGEDPTLPHFRDRHAVRREPTRPRLNPKQREAKDRYGRWVRSEIGVSFGEYLRCRLYEVA